MKKCFRVGYYIGTATLEGMKRRMIVTFRHMIEGCEPTLDNIWCFVAIKVKPLHHSGAAI